MIHSFDVETMFAVERPRLVRLCAHLSGNWDAAEDLAQETLLRAWNHIDRLHAKRQSTSWLSGIARNVCLEWSRRYYREQGRVVQPAYADSPDSKDIADELTSDFDLEFELEREELITFLEQALALLPPETRAVLIQKYVEDSPYAEIAARLGLSENSAAVRAHRGKLAFQRILANELRAEAEAFGLLHDVCDAWTETRIWCQLCGDHRLLGQFQKDAPAGVFALRCPSCNEGSIASGADLSLPYFAELLGAVKTYKPAYFRLLTTMGTYCRQALDSRAVPCLVCKRETSVWLGKRKDIKPKNDSGYEVRICCSTCHWRTNYSLDGFAIILPETQRFWRTHPRIRTLPTREIEANNTPALLTRLRSVSSKAGLDIVSLRSNFEIIGVYPTRDC